MNSYKYLHSQLGRTLEQIKRAYVSERRICFLVCSEPSFINRIIESEALFPNRKNKKDNQNASVRFVKDDTFIRSSFCHSSNDLVEIATPLLYVYTGCARYDYTQSNLVEDINLPLTSLTNYVNHYSSLSHANYILTEGQKEKLQSLKDSIILIPVKSIPRIPMYIEPYTEIVVVPFIDKEEFCEIVSLYLKETENAQTMVNENGYEILSETDFLDKLYYNMRGMNMTQILSVLKKNQVSLGKIYYSTLDPNYNLKLNHLIRNAKREFERIIETSRALTLENISGERPAGLDNLTNWLENYRQQVASPHEYRKYIIDAPKGILVSGIPGSGKSMMAQYVASVFKLSLLKLDFGNLGGAYVGDSEKNMDNALRIIEELSPCVLWVDEMEKAFSGVNNAGHEVTKRLVGKFLTWMQERTSRGISCFVFSTANDISQLPPEMFRSGRFDAKFYTFLPSAQECGEIFQSIISHQIARQKREDSYKENLQSKLLFNIEKINSKLFIELLNSPEYCLRQKIYSLNSREVNRSNKFFTGADINQLIQNAKNKYLHEYINQFSSYDDAVFESTKFILCLKNSMLELRTYGETNLNDIAKCYAQLAINNFNNASNSILLPFEGYDELYYASNRQNNNVLLYDLNRLSGNYEQTHFNSLATEYDKSQYIILRNTINQLAQDIINNRLS